MGKKRFRIQTLIVTVPNLAPAGVPIEGAITLDRSYDTCKGVAASIGVGFAASGNVYVDLGIRDAYGTIYDDCHMEQFLANAGVAPDDKFLTSDIPNSNQSIFGRVVPSAAVTAQFTVQFRFLCVDSQELIARI